jgi:uncharacterized protein DUF5615
MSQPLLLDEMFSDDTAQQPRVRGYDVISVVADSALLGLPDEQVLAYAATDGRALVTANIKDFVPEDGRCRAAGQSHAGLILVSTKTFPQNRGFPAAITTSLAYLRSRQPRAERCYADTSTIAPHAAAATSVTAKGTRRATSHFGQDRDNAQHRS